MQEHRTTFACTMSQEVGSKNIQMSHSHKGPRYLILLGDKTSTRFINLRPPHFF